MRFLQLIIDLICMFISVTVIVVGIAEIKLFIQRIVVFIGTVHVEACQ